MAETDALPAEPIVATFTESGMTNSELRAKLRKIDPSVLVSGAPVRTGEPPAHPDMVLMLVLALRHQVHAAFASAVNAGVPARTFLEIVSQEARRYLEQPVRDGYATPEEGLAAMLDAEGGCVDLATACKLFSRPGGVKRQTLTEKIHARELIAYQTGGDRWLLPKWQFRPQGGLLRGLPEVLKRLRDLSPEASELFAFTFFLQADPLLDGKTPLEVLKAGETEKVIEALESHPALSPA